MVVLPEKISADTRWAAADAVDDRRWLEAPRQCRLLLRAAEPEAAAGAEAPHESHHAQRMLPPSSTVQMPCTLDGSHHQLAAIIAVAAVLLKCKLEAKLSARLASHV